MHYIRRSGFSLWELLALLAIIAIVMAMLFPFTRRVREAAASTKCKNNLRQLMMGLHNFVATGAPAGLPGEHPNTFPTGCIGPGDSPEERLSWMVAVLPFLEQGNLYGKIDIAKGYAGNRETVQVPLKMFLCPGARMGQGEAVTHYIAMSGIGLDAAGQPTEAPGNGFMGYNRQTTLKLVKDDASSTIAVLETQSGLGSWARGGAATVRGLDPADVPSIGENRPFGNSDGANAAMVDGSVRFIRPSIAPAQIAAAITIAGGETFSWE